MLETGVWRRSLRADRSIALLGSASRTSNCIRRTGRSCAAAWPPCQAEWQLIAASHNLLKLWRAGPSRARTAITRRLARQLTAGATPRRAPFFHLPRSRQASGAYAGWKTLVPRLCATASRAKLLLSLSSSCSSGPAAICLGARARSRRQRERVSSA
jgi:hypothetical protein